MATIVDLPLSGANGSTSFPDNTGRAWSRPAISGNNAQIQNNALFLDGNNDVISTPSTADLVFENRPFVLEFEMNTSMPISASTAVIFDFDGNYSGGWLLGLRSNSAKVGLYNTSDGYVVETTMALNDGAWHKIRMEVTGRTVKLVVDGIDNASGVGNANMFSRDASVGGLRIGQGASASAQLAGSIRNVKITTTDPAPPLTHRPWFRRNYVGWDKVMAPRQVAMMPVRRHPDARIIVPRQFRLTRGVPPWWGSAGSTTQLPTYKIRGRVMIRDEVTGEDTPLPNIRVALFFRRLHTLIDIQLSDANGYVQFDNLMPGVQAYYGIAFDKDGTPLHNSVLWDRLSSEPGP